MNIIKEVQAGVISSAPPISSLIGSVISTLISVIGSIAVIVIIVAGIMYMTSGGEPARTQLAKKALTAGIVGLIICILSYLIVKMVVAIV